MRNEALAKIAAGALSSLLFCVSEGSACRFVPRPFEEHLDRAAVVFEGKASSVEPTGDPNAPVEVVFEVRRWWKGGTGRRFKLYTDDSSCGLRARVGQVWLILGSGRDKIRTGLPSGNVLLESDGGPAGNTVPDVLRKRLGKGVKPR